MTNETIMAVAGLLVAITAIAIFVKQVAGIVRKTVRFFDEWLGTEEEPGFAERVKRIEKDLNEVHKEVTYNSGTSLKDAVRRIEDFQKVNHERIVVIEDHLTRKR
jgi:thiaminase